MIEGKHTWEDRINETAEVEKLNEYDPDRHIPAIPFITVHYYHGNVKLCTHRQYQTPRLGELKVFDDQTWEVSAMRPALQTDEADSIIWVCDLRKRGRNE